MCALQYVLFLKIRSLIVTICALESSCEGRKGVHILLSILTSTRSSLSAHRDSSLLIRLLPSSHPLTRPSASSVFLPSSSPRAPLPKPDLQAALWSLELLDHFIAHKGFLKRARYPEFCWYCAIWDVCRGLAPGRRSESCANVACEDSVKSFECGAISYACLFSTNCCSSLATTRVRVGIMAAVPSLRSLAHCVCWAGFSVQLMLDT